MKLNVDLAPDEKQEFEPNIVNSTVYIIGIAMQIATVAVNYKGHPFMESLRENRLLSYAIFSSSAIVFCLALGIVPDLLEMFEVIDFDADVSAFNPCSTGFSKSDVHIIMHHLQDVFQQLSNRCICIIHCVRVRF